MRFFFYVVLFFSGYTSAVKSQVNITYPQWQHPVLQQLRAGSKNLVPFYNKDSTSFITVSVIDNKQKVIYWFDCYGYYFDAVPIGDNNIRAIFKKAITAFEYYNLITAGYLKVIIKARKNFQTNGNAAKFTAYEKQLLQIDDSIKFPSTLKKLIELDKQKLSVERQIREFAGIAPDKIKQDTVFSKTLALPYGSMLTTCEHDTITTYYNRIALEPVYKAVLNHHNATIAYFNRGNQLIDELPIDKDKVSLLFAEKTDVFLLYRGWLEMQRFNIVESIANIKASEKQFINAQKNIGSSQQVNAKNSFQPLLTYVNKLLENTEYKINYLTTIDRGFVSQCLKEQYRQISNSLSADEDRASTFARGNKFYELTDARGNVMAVVTDKKIQQSSNGTTVDYYEPDIASATDYAPFGGSLPGRNYQADKYRYGYNGKENDNDVKGEGNQQDYGMRIYDPRLGRFLSVDPITKQYPELTPYQFASNSPISGVDLDGLEYNNSSTYVLKVLPLLKKTTYLYIPQQQSTISTDWSPSGTPQSRNLQAEQRKNKAYNKATMDPLAGSMIYPVANSAGQFAEGTIQHGYGIYEGVQERNYWNAAKNTGLLVLDIAPFVPFKGGAAIETFYRTMTLEQAAIFEKTGVMTAGSETMISPTAAYAKTFGGITFEINTKAGTLKDLLKIGVADNSALVKPLELPSVSKGWKSTNAYFKAESNTEKGLPEQINIGLGNGEALTIFNKNITSFKKISTQPPPSQ